MLNSPFSLLARLKSIRFACEGMLAFFRTQHNAWIHLFFTVAVIITGLLVIITIVEWISLVLAMGFVWVTEIINTAIEGTMDHLSPAFHPRVKFIKDVAAAAVLFAAFTAIIIGLLIFIPKFF